MGDDGEAPKTLSPNPLLSPTFGKDGSFHIDEAVGSASISPSGRDVALASREGLFIIDLDNPYSPPRHLPHRTPWDVADVQWSPFACRDYWVVSTSNQKALVWNLDLSATHVSPIQYVLHAHSRAITDINFAAKNPDIIATCAVDSFIHSWDLRSPARPALTFADWYAGATQVKWNRKDAHVIASSHDKYLHIWDNRKGARPLKTISAHDTKIYGIDWDRKNPTHIVTCSLDKTIKLWDYTAENTQPSICIKTPYPVWRARHTPFGDGLLAMPQRGDNGLHLYHLRSSEETGTCTYRIPVHSFGGHREPVKEFLWRWRGEPDAGDDSREFQLVSWGSDKQLLLHKIDDEVLEKVNFRRGEPTDTRFDFTRLGAPYRTFHATKPTKDVAGRSMVPPQPNPSYLFRDPAWRNSRRSLANSMTKTFREAPDGGVMRARNVEKHRVNPIKWMKGVKLYRSARASSTTKRRASRAPVQLAMPTWDSPDGLGDEVAFVGNRYRKVSFEDVDVQGRSLIMSLEGPWGEDNQQVHLRVNAKFPARYPEEPPSFSPDKTSSIADVSYTEICYALQNICETYASVNRGCLEAVCGFLLGEIDLQKVLQWILDARDSWINSSMQDADESSSDEEGVGVGIVSELPAQDLQASDTDILATVNSNANVPLPKACAGVWAKDGRLVCFFPRRDHARSSLITFKNTFELDKNGRRQRDSKHFESFGRLLQPRHGRNRSSSPSDDKSESSDFSSSSSSDSSSSSQSTNRAGLETYGKDFSDRRFSRSSQARFTGRSHQSSANSIPALRTTNSISHISIHNIDDLLPAKRVIAKDYRIVGDSAEVCDQNSKAARQHRFEDLSDIWELVKHVLFNQIPLSRVAYPERDSDVFVLARRALVQIRKVRKDGSLDFTFDNPDSIQRPTATASLRWGHHPFGNAWLLQSLFGYFESVGDTQMLALLSCVVEDHHHTAFGREINVSRNETSSPYRQRFEYHPSEAMAQSFRYSGSTQLKGLLSSRPFNDEAVGSLDSNPGLGFANFPYSTGTTPPKIDSTVDDLSLENRWKRSNSSISAAFAASFSRPFSTFMNSASPPAIPVKTSELSTSAPTAASLQVASVMRRTAENQNAGIYSAKDNATEEALSDDEGIGTAIKVKNHRCFDEEAHLSEPLLDARLTRRSRLYRQMYAQLLFAWGLYLPHCEILKFNGIGTNYADTATSPASSVITIGEVANQPLPEYHPGVGLAFYCDECGKETPISRADTSSPYFPFCTVCHGTLSRRTCSICLETVSGLYQSCFDCGHVVHTDCLALYLETTDQLEDECKCGCGCLCGEEVGIEFGGLSSVYTLEEFWTRSTG